MGLSVEEDKLKTLERNWKAVNTLKPNALRKSGCCILKENVSSWPDSNSNKKTLTESEEIKLKNLETNWKPSLGKLRPMSAEKIFFEYINRKPRTPKLVKRWIPMTAKHDTETFHNHDNPVSGDNNAESKPNEPKQSTNKARSKSANDARKSVNAEQPKNQKVKSIKFTGKPWIYSSAKIQTNYPNTWLPGALLVSTKDLQKLISESKRIVN
jgi:hypothetical protein